MDMLHRAKRHPVDVPVQLTTVLDSASARIIDLSEHGAQIAGAAFPRGTKFQIEYGDQTVYAQCRWSEVDRMGVSFPFGLSGGPLHDILRQTIAPTVPGAPMRGTTKDGSGGKPFDRPAHQQPAPGATPWRRPDAQPFGRRAVG